MFKRFINKGILDKQKPRKRKRQRSKLWLFLTYTCGSIAILFICWTAFLKFEPNLVSQMSRKNLVEKNWKVSISPDDRSLLTSSHKKLIDFEIKKHLLTGSRDELKILADSILVNTEFDRVTIKRLYSDEIEIKVVIPEPIALIQSDELMYVSRNGHIFKSSHIGSDASKFVTIAGLIDPYQRKASFNKTNKLMLDDKEKLHLGNALSVIKMAEQQGLELKSLNHDEFRGISIELNSGAEVFLGHQPYDKKFLRLTNILANAEQSHSKIERIELDFNGKAFVKKLTTQQEL